MSDIIIIKPNDFSLKDIELCRKNDINPNDKITKIGGVNVEVFEKIIEKYIIKCTIDNSDGIIDQINKYLELTQEKTGDTSTMCIDNGIIYQLCYAYQNNKNNQTNQINRLASVLTNEQIPIYGNAILFCLNTPEKYKSVTIEDIFTLLMSKTYHYGIYINESNNNQQFLFNNALEIVEQNYEPTNKKPQLLLSKNSSKIKIDIFGYIFTIFYNNKSEAKINKYGKLLCEKDIKGSILIISSIPSDIYENLYDDIEIQTINEIIYLLENNVTHLTNCENYEKYNVLHNKYIELKK